MAAGQLVSCEKPDTIADGLRGALLRKPLHLSLLPIIVTQLHIPGVLRARSCHCSCIHLPCHLLAAGRLGDLTWPIMRDKVDLVVTVSEAEIVAAMRLCFERMKVRAALPSCPTALPWSAQRFFESEMQLPCPISTAAVRSDTGTVK